LLTFPVDPSMSNMLSLPKQVDLKSLRFIADSRFGYAVEKEKLQPWSSNLRAREVQGKCNKQFNIINHKFVWQIGQDSMMAVRSFLDLLLQLGAVPEFTRIDMKCKDVNFRFWFDASSEEIPAYYELGTMYDASATMQELYSSVFSRNLPDDTIIETIGRLDTTLNVLIRTCGIPSTM